MMTLRAVVMQITTVVIPFYQIYVSRVEKNNDSSDTNNDSDDTISDSGDTNNDSGDDINDSGDTILAKGSLSEPIGFSITLVL